MTRKARGTARTIEGLIALILVLATTLALQVYTPTAPIADEQLKGNVNLAIISLDASGRLPAIINRDSQTGDWTDLTYALAASLPSSTAFVLTIYSTGSSTPLPGTPISYGKGGNSIVTIQYTTSYYDPATGNTSTYNLILVAAR
jgi:hypothetical protein